jgi:hypothetical protein
VSVVSVVCCQLEVSVLGCSLVQSRPTECDREPSVMGKPWPTGSCRDKIKKMWILICSKINCFVFRNSIKVVGPCWSRDKVRKIVMRKWVECSKIRNSDKSK